VNILLDELQELLQLRNENERIEFKEAKADFSIEKLAKYCAALSNEGGGKLILGVTDKKPRLIVGTQAFVDLNRCKLSITQKLRLRIEIQEMECPAQQRIEFTKGFLLYFDELWQTINLRNDKQHFQDGFIVLDVPTFNEKVVREAVLNAVAHRDYRSAGSVFVRQFPRKIEIQSPGGLPDGITPENILWKQHPRNRRIAEIFLKCGLVERSGQGANLIFKETICQGKPLPNFDHTDTTQVFLTLLGDIQDPSFLRFLEKIGQERLRSFSIEDFLILDLIHREEQIPQKWQSNIKHLIEAGILEKHGRGRGVRYLFSRRYYSFIGKSGAYTRKLGLDRATNKELLLKHIIAHAQTGSRLQELMQVLPMLSKDQVQKLVKELKIQSAIYNKGTTRSALWYPVSIAPK
jgi:ATP-dependent DNA helicase RecG